MRELSSGDRRRLARFAEVSRVGWLERKRKDVAIDDVDFANALTSTVKTAPVNVVVELKGDKLLRVRRA